MFIRSTAAGDRLGGLAPATRAAASALAAAFDVVVIETVGVGQSETEVADVADTVAVVVQPGSGDVLQFLKAGIMEVPDVLVVTKSDLGQIADAGASPTCGRRCASLGAAGVEVVAVSSVAPPSGIDELGAGARSPPRRPRPAGAAASRPPDARAGGLRRPSTASAACAPLGGRREAERWLSTRIPGSTCAALRATALRARRRGPSDPA